MKTRRLCVLLALLMVWSVPAFGGGMPLNAAATHCGSEQAVYGADSYLYDTLTLAGSGFETVLNYTVYALEELALAEPALGFEGEYSLMTSGSEFSRSVFIGIRLYDFLVYAGLDPALDDKTPVKMISKDGYSMTFSLGQVKADYKRFSEKGAMEAETADLPVLIAFGCNGAPLVGPTGEQPVTMRFEEKDGFVEACGNIGGPLRLVMGMNSSLEFNAPNCAKWLSAIVVGDANGYTYARSIKQEELGEPDPAGDWTHADDAYPEYRLTVRGSQVKERVYTLQELEALREGAVRAYCAASAGLNAYEGIALRYVVQQCLLEGISMPDSITLVAADGYTKQMDVRDVMQGVDSMYQPGQHRDVLLAYAIDGAPMVEGTESDGYDGSNAYGPVRLVVENTISAWVKGVVEIIVGD